VRKKTFATFLINHHGDGRIALWLNAPSGAQQLYVRAEPKHFFVPPYVGPSGWLGVNVDKGIAWQRVGQLVREAYEKAAPPALVKKIGPLTVKPPARKPRLADLDPMQSKRAQAVIEDMRKVCLSLPDTAEDKQFGNPVWKVGKRVFAQAYCYRDRKLQIAFWVGIDQQSFYSNDKRYEIPPYMGHNGWIALDVSKSANWKEIRALALFSFRHFALRRTLAKLDDR
jgi:predicted DNA-binding protein (MmcQ/YjbR family)